MQRESKFLDDLASVASSALGTAGGVKGEVEAVFRRRLEEILANMDLVQRDEFDAVKEMLIKAREEQERLVSRLEELEATLKNRN
mgnify:CR=1 FL=1